MRRQPVPVVRQPQQQRPEGADVHVEGVRQHGGPDGLQHDGAGLEQHIGSQARAVGTDERRTTRLSALSTCLSERRSAELASQDRVHNRNVRCGREVGLTPKNEVQRVSPVGLERDLRGDALVGQITFGIGHQKRA